MQKPSTLLYKTRCPKCAENGLDTTGDNLGIYSDGHSYCFSCGYFLYGNSLEKLKVQKFGITKNQLHLPEDITQNIPKIPFEWLQQYYRDSVSLFWSEQKQWLIFPIYINGELIAYQARNFGIGPKWIGFNISNSLFYILGNRSNEIVLVEDIISALKVSSIKQSMPLFGSHIGLRRLARLKEIGIGKVWVWLDADKRSYALSSAKESLLLGLETRVIYTELDPKEYSLFEITRQLQ